MGQQHQQITLMPLDKRFDAANRVIGPDEALLTSGLIDSFNLVDLGLYVEDTFGVRIDDTELNSSTFDNLNQLAALIQSRQ